MCIFGTFLFRWPGLSPLSEGVITFAVKASPSDNDRPVSLQSDWFQYLSDKLFVNEFCQGGSFC